MRCVQGPGSLAGADAPAGLPCCSHRPETTPGVITHDIFNPHAAFGLRPCRAWPCPVPPAALPRARTRLVPQFRGAGAVPAGMRGGAACALRCSNSANPPEPPGQPEPLRSAPSSPEQRLTLRRQRGTRLPGTRCRG